MRDTFRRVILAMARIFFLIVIWAMITSPVAAQVVINEFSPTSETEWIEFYNASPSAEYLKSYFIDDDISFSDDAGNSSKRPLNDIVTSNSTYPYFEVSSFFNNSGDYVVLFTNDGTRIDYYHYDKDPGEVTIGRSPDQSGNFYILLAATKGGSNAQPLVSPALVSTPPPSPTLLPTPKPTSFPTPKASTIINKKVSPVPSKKTTPQSSSLVLGEAAASPSPGVSPPPEAVGKKGSSFPAGLLFIAGGLMFSGAAGFLFYKKMEHKSAEV